MAPPAPNALSFGNAATAAARPLPANRIVSPFVGNVLAPAFGSPFAGSSQAMRAIAVASGRVELPPQYVAMFADEASVRLESQVALCKMHLSRARSARGPDKAAAYTLVVSLIQEIGELAGALGGIAIIRALALNDSAMDQMERENYTLWVPPVREISRRLSSQPIVGMNPGAIFVAGSTGSGFMTLGDAENDDRLVMSAGGGGSGDGTSTGSASGAAGGRGVGGATGGGDGNGPNDPLAAVDEEMRAYAALDPSVRLDAVIDAAFRRGAIPTRDPSWLTFSPFGVHASQIAYLRNSHESPLAGWDAWHGSVRIGHFGAGLDDHMAYLNGYLADLGRPRLSGADDAFAPLLTAQRTLFAPLQATSYEPRTVLAFMLDGDRHGELHVFDNHPDVPTDLRRPAFSWLDAWGAYEQNPPMDTNLLNRLWGFAARERDVTMRIHGLGPTGQAIVSQSFDFTPTEMDRIRVHPLDLATDRMPETELDLSIWFEGWYFLPGRLSLVGLARVIQSTRVGGYIVTDIPMQSDIMLSNMGIEPVGEMRTHMLRGKIHLTSIYRKVAETSYVQGLADLTVPR